MESDDITISAEASISEYRLTLTFVNNSQEPEAFLIGRGIPPYRVDPNPKDGAFIISAVFYCPLEYVHDCFHAERIELHPGESKETAFDWAIGEPLAALKNKGAVKCKYVTLSRKSRQE